MEALTGHLIQIGRVAVRVSFDETGMWKSTHLRPSLSNFAAESTKRQWNVTQLCGLIAGMSDGRGVDALWAFVY